MCKAIDDMVKTGRREERRENSIKYLMMVLRKMGNVSNDLQNMIYQQKDVRVLEKWFKKAISVQSLEEFVDYVQKDKGMAKVG